MKVEHTYATGFVVCGECCRMADYLILIATSVHLCEYCLTEALALLRHETSANQEAHPNVVNED